MFLYWVDSRTEIYVLAKKPSFFSDRRNTKNVPTSIAMNAILQLLVYSVFYFSLGHQCKTKTIVVRRVGHVNLILAEEPGIFAACSNIASS